MLRGPLTTREAGNMMENSIEGTSFESLIPGDTVVRMLGGQIPMDMTVEKIEDDLIYMVGGWTFDPATGYEVDEELNLPEGVIASYLIKD